MKVMGMGIQEGEKGRGFSHLKAMKHRVILPS